MAKGQSAKRKGSSRLGCVGLIYVIGFVATAAWYAVTLFDGDCDARSLRGRCIDESMIDIFVYSLIWPLHWLFEVLEAIGA